MDDYHKSLHNLTFLILNAENNKCMYTGQFTDVSNYWISHRPASPPYSPPSHGSWTFFNDSAEATFKVTEDH